MLDAMVLLSTVAFFMLYLDLAAHRQKMLRSIREIRERHQETKRGGFKSAGSNSGADLKH